MQPESIPESLRRPSSAIVLRSPALQLRALPHHSWFQCLLPRTELQAGQQPPPTPQEDARAPRR